MFKANLFLSLLILFLSAKASINSEIIQAKNIKVKDILNGKVEIIGKLGYPLFTLLTIEGFFTVEENISYFEIKKINGVRLRKSVRFLSNQVRPFWIHNASLNKVFYGEQWDWSIDPDSKVTEPTPMFEFDKDLKILAVETGQFTPVSTDAWKTIKDNYNIYPFSGGFDNGLYFLSVKYIK